MAGRIELDVEGVKKAVNTISDMSQVIMDESNKLLRAVEEAVQSTQGNSSPLVYIKTQLDNEIKNLNTLAQTQDEIQALTRKFEELMADADDISDLKRMAGE